MFKFFSHNGTAKLQTIFLKTWRLLEIVNLKKTEGILQLKLALCHQIAFFFTIFLIKDLKSSKPTR